MTPLWLGYNRKVKELYFNNILTCIGIAHAIIDLSVLENAAFFNSDLSQILAC